MIIYSVYGSCVGEAENHAAIVIASDAVDLPHAEEMRIATLRMPIMIQTILRMHGSY